MYLQEVFNQLSEGELTQTNLGTVTEDKWSRVVNHINLGLGDLFKRFFLREGRLKMQLISGQTTYPLDVKYAAANTRSRIGEASRFILDSAAARFAGDVLKVEKVLTEDGFELGFNSATSRWPIKVTDTAPPTLLVHTDIVEQASDLPEEMRTSLLEVVYRARHPKIDIEAAGFDPERYEVKLPDSHLQALLYYVASRALGPVGMGQAEGVSSAGYWQRYEAECAQLTLAGVQIDQSEGYDKLRDRGFV
jgi:hypothetical protein